MNAFHKEKFLSSGQKIYVIDKNSGKRVLHRDHLVILAPDIARYKTLRIVQDLGLVSYCRVLHASSCRTLPRAVLQRVEIGE